jgi:hypothetical protein
LTRHDDVAAVLRDRAHSVDPRKGAPDTYASTFLLPNLPPDPFGSTRSYRNRL